VVSCREGSNAEPKVENVMSSAQSHLKPEHEIELSDAASDIPRKEKSENSRVFTGDLNGGPGWT
jgi:hypothetical protein